MNEECLITPSKTQVWKLKIKPTIRLRKKSVIWHHDQSEETIESSCKKQWKWLK